MGAGGKFAYFSLIGPAAAGAGNRVKEKRDAKKMPASMITNFRLIFHTSFVKKVQAI